MSTFARTGSTAIVFTMNARGPKTMSRTVAQLVTFSSVGSRVMAVSYTRSGSSSIAFANADVTYRSFPRSAITPISIASVPSYFKAYGLSGESVISFLSTPFRSMIKKQSIVHQIFFGSGGLVEEALVPNKVFFLWPILSPLVAIPLPFPQCPDKDRIVIQTISRHSRSGDRYAYKRTPSYEIFTMDFENIYFSQLDSLKEFFEETAGDTVKYIDQHGRKWVGIILTDPIEFTSMCKFLTCPTGRVELYSFSLEFEGEITN